MFIHDGYSIMCNCIVVLSYSNLNYDSRKCCFRLDIVPCFDDNVNEVGFPV